MSDNRTVVKDFISAFNANDVRRIMDFFCEDCDSGDLPFAPAAGPNALLGLRELLAMSSEVNWVLHNIAENSEGIVLTERTDRYLVGKEWVEFPVMGTFDVRGGKICGWRDYFGTRKFQGELPG